MAWEPPTGKPLDHLEDPSGPGTHLPTAIPLRQTIPLHPIAAVEAAPFDAAAVIRRGGLRVTSARVAVLEYLRRHGGTQTHADVVRAFPEMDRVTLYRCLTDLAGVGLLARTDLGDHVWRFEYLAPRDAATDSSAHRASEADGALLSGSSVTAHPHFVCLECGDVRCLDEVQLPLPAELVLGGRVREILIKGACARCV